MSDIGMEYFFMRDIRKVSNPEMEGVFLRLWRGFACRIQREAHHYDRVSELSQRQHADIGLLAYSAQYETTNRQVLFIR